jgi:hypothetical protein
MTTPLTIESGDVLGIEESPFIFQPASND